MPVRSLTRPPISIRWYTQLTPVCGRHRHSATPATTKGTGSSFTDFHDHVLDSIPAHPGHGEFNPLWHVFLIVPADPSPAGQAAYAAMLPMTSEAAVDAAVDSGVAQEIDTQFYFLCSVVSPNAAK